MSRPLRFVPLFVLLLLVAALGSRLAKPDDTAIKSRLVGQAMPMLRLDAIVPGKPGFSATGGPRLVNFFASWCVPCIAEGPLLMELKRQGVVIDGIAVRDQSDDVAAFLAQRGDPFRQVGSDLDSRAQMLLGASGVPETFLVDGAGVIRFQHVGPLDASDLPEIQRQWAALR